MQLVHLGILRCAATRLRGGSDGAGPCPPTTQPKLPADSPSPWFYRLFTTIVRRAQQWKHKEYLARYENTMSGSGIRTQGVINRYATRYGGIIERVRGVDDIRKVVLIVNASLPTSEAHDVYTERFRRCC
ncbi:hypothetical protein BDV59DRAFT_188860 [Aspergillus ambiguus]|uniref:uncharacterized protein n=1 Tax=Aspergillus ambiguus TaxID=176160 RepID=UPI003CCD5B76